MTTVLIWIPLVSSQDGGGHNTIYNFHASWCEPCKKMDKIWKDKDVQILLQKYVGKEKKDIDVDDPESDRLMSLYKIESIPSFVIVDLRGFILYRHTGIMTKSELKRILTTYGR